MLLGGSGRKRLVGHSLLVLVIDLFDRGPMRRSEERRAVRGVVIVEQFLSLQVEDEILDGIVVILGEEGVAVEQGRKGGQRVEGGFSAFVFTGGPAVADEVLYVFVKILEINLVFCI